MKKNRLTKFFVLLGIVFLMISVGSVYSNREEHEFILKKAEASPYVLNFPLRLDGPGEIKVDVRVTNADITMEQPLSVSIIQKRSPKNVIQAVAMYKAGNKSVELVHEVDRKELALGTNYIIALTNFSRNKNAAGKIFVAYQDKGRGKDRKRHDEPDLSITDLRLNDQNMLQVEITNHGPGRIPPKSYEKDVPTVYIFRDGNGWGGAALNIIDPNKLLREPGGKVVYTFTGLIIQRTEKIRAIVDYQNTLEENDENNNELRRELTGARGKDWKHGRDDRIGNINPTGNNTKPVYPDLAIKRAIPTQSSNMEVEVVNNGPGQLSPDYWKKKIPILTVYRFGKEWGTVTLDKLDPDMKLAAPGGKVVFVDYQVRFTGTETVRLVIDPKNNIPESDETNNELTATLGYRR